VIIRSRFAAITSLIAILACSGEKTPGAGDTVSVVPPAGQAVATSDDPRASIFLNKGCPQCHSISGLGIKSPAEIGPDLTLAYEDVQTRFSMPLEQFLHNPTGTMQIVLSSQIQLSTAERDSIIHILKELHENREEEGEDHE
jgi:hypothetical protein